MSLFVFDCPSLFISHAWSVNNLVCPVPFTHHSLMVQSCSLISCIYGCKVVHTSLWSLQRGLLNHGSMNGRGKMPAMRGSKMHMISWLDMPDDVFFFATDATRFVSWRDVNLPLGAVLLLMFQNFFTSVVFAWMQQQCCVWPWLTEFNGGVRICLVPLRLALFTENDMPTKLENSPKNSSRQVFRRGHRSRKVASTVKSLMKDILA